MSTLVEKEYSILNTLGLHARAAAQLVQAANSFRSEVLLECEGQTVNGKSIMGVLMLAASQGMTVKVRCNGADAAACLEAIARLIEGKFGEVE